MAGTAFDPARIAERYWQIVQADETLDPQRRYLVCVAERDLTALMPMLPELAGSPAE